MGYSDTRHIKKLYNYACETIRDKDEMFEDMAEEFAYNKQNRSTQMQALIR